MTDKDQLDNPKGIQNLQMSELDDVRNRSDYVTDWISQTEFSDYSLEANSFVYSSSVVDSESYFDDIQKLSVDEGKAVALDTNANSVEILKTMDVLQQVIQTENSVQGVNANPQIININSVAGPVHIGNVIYIKGPIHITDNKGGHIGVINQPGGDTFKLIHVDDDDLIQQAGNIRISGENVSKQTTSMATGTTATAAPTTTPTDSPSTTATTDAPTTRAQQPKVSKSDKIEEAQTVEFSTMEIIKAHNLFLRHHPEDFLRWRFHK